MNYNDFLESKRLHFKPCGFEPGEINPILFDFQHDIVKWACRKGKSCIFAGTGLGKTFMQVEWSRLVMEHTGGTGLIVAPLAVSAQTVEEAKKIGVLVNLCKSVEDVNPGINITNYERLEKFADFKFDFVVLDESSILKNYAGAMRNSIIDQFASTSYKLACTATPAPNDYMELGNHAEFVGVMTRSEMLAMYFVHDGGDTSKWRLKGHAVDKFWQWVAGWAVMVTKPSDLGYENRGFDLPPLRIHQITVESKVTNGLFAVEALTLQERREARKASIDDRVQACTDIIEQYRDDKWIIWCNLNEESVKLTKAIDGIEVTGSDAPEVKESRMLGFAAGKFSRLVSKPSICGMGMNWQHCHKVAFVGLSDSFEEYYQAVRRCWRFGQKYPVDVYVITSEAEGAVVDNIRRKERDFETMLSGMISATQEITKENLKGTARDESTYEESIDWGENWTLMLGDCVERLKEVKDDSVGYSIFSPPFASLYTYSNSDRDLGNSKNFDEFATHFKFLIKELYRVIMPGRSVSIHCMDIPAMKERDGYIGLKDFPGEILRMFQAEGFIYHSKAIIWKDPLIEATRTKALGLMHKQIVKDSSMCRQGLPDYLITMRKPGDNPNSINHPNGFTNFIGEDEPNAPIKEPDIKDSRKHRTISMCKADPVYSHHVWRKYASPVWMDINQSNTLQRESAREEADERHICPLQLDVIERGLELWSKKGDLVLSPFAGIGSEGYTAVKMGRKFIGIELKKSYWQQACANLKRAEITAEGMSLFADSPV